MTVDTNFGNFQIELRPNAAPKTVANFLQYVESGAYTDSIFHRSVPGFVEQAGGFTSASTTFTSTSQFTTIPTNAAVPLEYSLPNVVGSVAMARTSDANSATDEWFVNVVDNSTSLGPGGSDQYGYTVFGQVIGNGMQVLDAIAALSVDNADNGGTFSQLPLGTNNELVRISSVTIDSIDGTVFSDTNGNGQLDSGEPGIAGRTIFIDQAGTGIYQSGDPTATTDSSGNYSFSGLAAGSYTVEEVLPSGGTLTTPTQTVTVTTGQTTSGIIFGELPSITGTATISGTVFDDVDLNGTDSGDPGLAGRTVFLNVDGSGAPDSSNPSTTTDAKGNFSFTGLAAGTYTVDEVLTPAGSVSITTKPVTLSLTTGQNVSGVMIGDALDSSIVPLKMAPITPQAASDANTAYIDALYQSILGHAPDAAGLASWQQQMASGVDRATVAQGIWDSDEHRGLQVEQFYEIFLGRASDPVGKAYWVAAFGSWGTEQVETAGFLGSQEYQNLHTGNTSLIDAVYADVAERPADASGESYWVSQLNSGTPQLQVLFSFIYGQEASTAVVDSFYSDFLHRAPDSASLQSWVNDLTSQSMTADQVAIQILASDECFNGVTADTAPTITNAAATTFTEGTAGTFTVSTSGIPIGTITESGTLPSGVTFTDNRNGTATLAGTPATGSAGTYDLTLTVNNGVGTAATQKFTLTIT